MVSESAERSRPASLFVFALLIQLLLVGVAAWLHASLSNTLLENGRWSSTKATLGRKVMGARNYVNSRQTLADEKLDLGRWHGYQEVLLDEPLSLRSFGFDFRLDPDTYLVFWFDRSAQRSLGLRLSLHPHHPSIRFRADRDGAFLERHPLAGDLLIAGQWSRLEGRLADHQLVVTLDGVEFDRFAVASDAPWRPGFRGSEKAVLVDNVLFGSPDGQTEEDFHNRDGLLRNLAIGLLLMLLLNGGGLLLARRLQLNSRQVLFPALTALLVLGVGSLLVIGVYRTFLSKTYPAELAAREQAWRESEIAGIEAQIRGRTPLQAAAGTRRIVFLGSSQTWGAGADRTEAAFVPRIERLLNRAAVDDLRHECMNTAVSGLRSGRLLQQYRDHWLAYRPDLVVVNLAVNDADPEELESSLDALAALNRERGIATLFSLEATSEQQPHDDEPMREVMRRVGKRHSIRVVDTHAYLDARRDTGLLWWDFVHPTSYGHRLIAECLAAEIGRLFDGSGI